MRVSDVVCSPYDRSYILSARTTNYYGCIYFFNVFSKIRHVYIHPEISKGSFTNESYTLGVQFRLTLSSRFFEFNIIDKPEVLNWISCQCVENVLKNFLLHV